MPFCLMNGAYYGDQTFRYSQRELIAAKQVWKGKVSCM